MTRLLTSLILLGVMITSLATPAMANLAMANMAVPMQQANGLMQLAILETLRHEHAEFALTTKQQLRHGRRRILLANQMTRGKSQFGNYTLVQQALCEAVDVSPQLTLERCARARQTLRW